MAKGVYKNIDGVYKRIKNNLDCRSSENPESINIITLYAHNGSGKTRLSKIFQERYEENILCYNAFLEDYFTWNNETSVFNINTNSWVFKLIKSEEIDKEITTHFQELTNSKIEPFIDFKTGEITFKLQTGDERSQNSIKISRGEESIFVWCVFYSILEVAIKSLDVELNNRSTHIFDKIKYIIIDDPVSSMDDERIITVALKVAKIIVDSKNKFNFLITTHHPLFFNVMFHKKNEKWNKINYILSKTDAGLKLKKQCDESPFAYHHTIIYEIKNAISKNQLKKYHFNLFRTLLEKTANFLGYKHWNKCLSGMDVQEDFLKIIDHYSHDKLSELEYNDLIESQIDAYNEVFDKFLVKYNFYDEVESHEQ